MSTFIPMKKKCAICGKKNIYEELAGTSSFGSPDLDLRPAPLQRNMMFLWVQECPECGYVSSDISKKSKIKKNFLQSVEYKKCDGLSFMSDLSEKFYRLYLIMSATNKTEEAFWALLHGAWACDDVSDEENAKHLREMSLPLITEMICENNENKTNYLLVKADILRRAGHFNELLEEYSSVKPEDELLMQILLFELQKAREKDTKCYTVQDAVPEF